MLKELLLNCCLHLSVDFPVLYGFLSQSKSMRFGQFFTLNSPKVQVKNVNRCFFVDFIAICQLCPQMSFVLQSPVDSTSVNTPTVSSLLCP